MFYAAELLPQVEYKEGGMEWTKASIGGSGTTNIVSPSQP